MSNILAIGVFPHELVQSLQVAFRSVGSELFVINLIDSNILQECHRNKCHYASFINCIVYEILGLKESYLYTTNTTKYIRGSKLLDEHSRTVLEHLRDENSRAVYEHLCGDANGTLSVVDSVIVSLLDVHGIAVGAAKSFVTRGHRDESASTNTELERVTESFISSELTTLTYLHIDLNAIGVNNIFLTDDKLARVIEAKHSKSFSSHTVVNLCDTMEQSETMVLSNKNIQNMGFNVEKCTENIVLNTLHKIMTK